MSLQRVEELSALGNATAGGLGSFFSSFTLCPTELIKVQLQAARELALINDKHVSHTSARPTENQFCYI